jgi:hypothetical protein
MPTETQNKPISNAVRIGRDKMERAARIARKQAADRDEKVSMSSVVDEILEEGLTKREKKLGL